MTNYATLECMTKKALKDAINGGAVIGVERQSIFDPGMVQEGEVAICGPHYPKPHKWYGTATVKNGMIVRLV